MSIALPGNGASWTSVSGPLRFDRTGFARANRFRGVKRPCRDADRRLGSGSGVGRRARMGIEVVR